MLSESSFPFDIKPCKITNIALLNTDDAIDNPIDILIHSNLPNGVENAVRGALVSLSEMPQYADNKSMFEKTVLDPIENKISDIRGKTVGLRKVFWFMNLESRQILNREESVLVPTV